MSSKKYLLIIICVITWLYPSSGQQMPFNPISYRIFSPFVLNPAIAGSKDFFSTDFLFGFTGKSYSQILSGNARIAIKGPKYTESAAIKSFTNFGVGASVFNDFNNFDSTHTSGFNVALSYHIPLNNKGLTYLSVGASGKGLYHYYAGDYDFSIPPKEFYFPNVDFGIYLYGPDLMAGVSATNLLGAPSDTSVINNYSVPVSRQYNFIAAYKFLVYRPLNIVVEPSVIITTDDSLSFKPKENIEPLLKIYIGNFCIGTYFNDYSKVSFFFQYRYPKFYLGTFFALPKDTPYFQKSPTTEIAFGINFSRNRSGYNRTSHW